MPSLRGCDKAEVVTVIKTKTVCGAGTVEDPVRFLYQYWDFEGKLLAEYDTIDEINNG